MTSLVPPLVRPVPARLPTVLSSAAPVRRPSRPLPRWLRTVSTVLVPIYLVSSLPGYLLAQADASARELAGVVVESLQPAPAPPPEIKVTVNRTLPADVLAAEAARSANPLPGAAPAPASAAPRFSTAPTDEEFFRARLFEEPLAPTDAKPVAGENAALAQALVAYEAVGTGANGGNAETERLAPLTRFLANYPASRWALTLWLNLGLTYRKSGYWTRALDAWERAWTAGKGARDPRAAALADRAVAELAELNARLGRFERLEPLFAELDAAKRSLRGSAADKLLGARQGLWLMNNRPEDAFRCGPMALNSLRVAANPQAPVEPKLLGARSTRQGIALAQVAALSREIGRPLQMARRVVPAVAAGDKPGKAKTAGAPQIGTASSPLAAPGFITPAVVHWKAGHYAALVEERNGRFRVEDPTFGDVTWVSRAALEAETSGYFLVAADLPLPKGWQPVPEKEARKVWGKGTTGSNDPNATSCTDVMTKPCPSCGGSPGMADYNVHAMLVSLSLGDTPLAYAPPRGQPIAFSAQYAQREANQPQVFTFWNLGSKWTSNWLSYVSDNGTAVWIANGTGRYLSGGASSGPYPITTLAGGGIETYPTAIPVNNRPDYYPQIGDPYCYRFYTGEQSPIQAKARLVQTDFDSYERRLSDGTVETFAHSDGASHYPRRIFLSKRTDPSGNATRFRYDSQHRLRAVEDALGQVTTLFYEFGGDPLKVTRLTDPFGRTCRLDYNAQGQLAAITDTAGLQSAFTYAQGSDFIDSLTTPYGTTTFARGDASTDPSLGTTRWLEATDPYGDKERAEYRHNAPGIPFNESVVPQGIPTFNAYINARNAFFWDKKAYKEARQGDGTLDYTKARLFHFLHSSDTNVTGGKLESTKEPFENRVWLGYQNQSWAGGMNPGMGTQPTVAGRVLDDGSTQLSQVAYNAEQRVTRSTDPLGRETTLVYDPANNVDLLEVRRTTGGMNELLGKTTYNAQHQPRTVTDASGQTTTLTYNSFGQPKTVQDPLGRTTTFNYDAQGYLQEIVSPNPGVKTAFGYDGFGRLNRTTSYPDAYTVQVGYDAVGGNPLASLNRPATATFPDGSYTETDYTNLSVEWTRDRAGNWTHLLTNKLRQTEAVIDPEGRITQYAYCKCGSLKGITDPNGNVTRWEIDAQGRVTAKIMADGSETDFAYENTTSRLKRVTDAKGQSANYSYYLDGALQSVTYTNAEHPTPGVSFTYDPQRGRLATMSDGFGATTYDYYPGGDGTGAAVLGAGRLRSVTGPWANSAVGFEYDQLGRLHRRTVGDAAEQWDFDAQGRLASDTNALGAFAYAYDGLSSRLVQVSYPNGQSVGFSYLEDNAQDRRLAQIQNLGPGGAVLSQFTYGYDGPLGRISSWTQQQGGDTHNYALSYDMVGQLKRAVFDNAPADPRSAAWGYDAAGNRTSTQVGSDSTLTQAIPSATNALFSLRGGAMRIAGTLSKPARQVQVNGQAAQVNPADNSFEALLALSAGQHTVTVQASDLNGNTGSQSWQVTSPGGAREDFGYDLNGNTTADSPQGGNAGSVTTFEWDAADRVIAINKGQHRTEFGYDGKGKRVRITEKESGTTTSDRLYVNGEERDASSGQTIRRFFSQGEQRLGGSDAGAYFHTRDHLGSLRELTDSAGAVRVRYAYDLWGQRSKLGGDLDTEAGFTGYWWLQGAGLWASPNRLYSAPLGRFVNQDPIGLSGGANLYRYVRNDPVNQIDPLGLAPVVPWTGPYLNSPVALGGTAGGAAAGGGAVTVIGAVVLPALAVAAWTPAGQDWITHNIVDPWLDILAPLPQSDMPPPRKPPRPPSTGSDCPNPPNGDNEDNARGREAHKWWEPPEGYEKEFTFDNGLRADAVNIQTRDILELKPNNPRAIARGEQQIQQYIQQAQIQFGGTWTGRVVTY